MTATLRTRTDRRMTTTELVTLAVGVALIIAGAAVTAVGIALNLNLIP